MEEMIGKKQNPPIVLSKFLEDYTELLRNSIPPQPINVRSVQELELPKERLEAAEQNCVLTDLIKNDDPFINKFVPGYPQQFFNNIANIPDEALTMLTVKELTQAKAKSTRNPFKRSRVCFKLTPLPEHESHSIKCSFYNDLIITIRVYRPARATHVGKTLEKPVFAEEFQCLGSNFLCELRDKINCICNKYRYFDISDDPNTKMIEKTTDPGYFFINDTFYNDHRNPDNVDYSETIINWSKKANGLQNLNFKVAKMENTRFIDLTVSLGFPQLYQHHGNCEHVFVFSQIEIASPSLECLYWCQYPRLCSVNNFNNRLCNMCGTQHCIYIVEKSDRQLHDPAYLCNKCFISFHYIDGKKVGNFLAYRLNDAVVNEATNTSDNDNVDNLSLQ